MLNNLAVGETHAGNAYYYTNTKSKACDIAILQCSRNVNPLSDCAAKTALRFSQEKIAKEYVVDHVKRIEIAIVCKIEHDC